MTIIQTIDRASADAVSGLIAGLESRSGSVVDRVCEAGLHAAEESDFCWDARIEERFLGSHESLDEEDFELDCVEIIGRLDGIWFIAICLVDGDGQVHGLTGRRTFASDGDAQKAWAR